MNNEANVFYLGNIFLVNVISGYCEIIFALYIVSSIHLNISIFKFILLSRRLFFKFFSMLQPRVSPANG